VLRDRWKPSHTVYGTTASASDAYVCLPIDILCQLDPLFNNHNSAMKLFASLSYSRYFFPEIYAVTVGEMHKRRISASTTVSTFHKYIYVSVMKTDITQCFLHSTPLEHHIITNSIQRQ